MILDINRRLHENPREKLRIISTTQGISGAIVDFYGNIILNTDVIEPNYSFQGTIDRFDKQNGTDLVSITDSNPYLTTVLERLFKNQSLLKNGLSQCCIFYVTENKGKDIFTFDFGRVDLVHKNIEQFNLTNTLMSTTSSRNFTKAYKKAKLEKSMMEMLPN